LTQTIRSELGAQEVFHFLNGAHAKTFPSWLPALRLDRIYYRGLRVQSGQCLTEPPWSQLSDHAALFAEMVITE
jgi:endonuclease/exonuclease/phosphatase family metal-dependent hydrolase